MKVKLIAKTEPDIDLFQGKAEGSAFARRDDFFPEGQVLIEFAGRLCYESFDLPNKKTEMNSAYVQNIVKLGHESVLEHVSVTFYVEGVSRNLSHELIRHRHLSFSELSQRYVDMNEARWVVPPLWREIGADWTGKYSVPLEQSVLSAYKHNVREAEGQDGVTRKEAREAARAVLPGGVETKFVVSGNLRAWRDVLKKRWSSHADKEMQDFAAKVLGWLSEEYPDVFADITYE